MYVHTGCPKKQSHKFKGDFRPFNGFSAFRPFKGLKSPLNLCDSFLGHPVQCRAGEILPLRGDLQQDHRGGCGQGNQTVNQLIFSFLSI